MEPSYQFGAYRLVPAQRALYEGDRPVKLGARALDMLVALVERRDRVVGKDELLSVVWPGLVVEENNLQVQVVTLRKLLGHPAIATVPGRGYRFTTPVRVEGGPSETASMSPAMPLPVAPSPTRPPLIGREADLQALAAMTAEPGLVSVVGAGGIGKTRLALAAADAMRARGLTVCVVDLAPVTDPALLANTVGRVLGYGVDGPEAVQRLASALQDHAWLVLDNVEHLLDAVATFVEGLRQQQPGLGVLVTSQEVMRVAGEQVFRAAPLSLPAADTVPAVAGSGAGALFVARATAADARFRLNEANAGAVADICRRLDAIPLAIELAASRMGLLGLEGLRQRLNDRFHLLTGGARVALRRHQTLRAALEWSHGLLTTPEQAVFRRLGSFVGGFALEAGQQVAESDEIDGWDVVEHLGSLVDKSLVLVDDSDPPRYRMLETTRLFALERLADAGETDATLRRHAEAIADLVGLRALTPRRWTIGAAAFEADAAELDNARAAIEWVAQSGDLGLSLRVATRTALAFVRADMLNEQFRRLRPLAARIDATVPADLASMFWLRLAGAGVRSASQEAWAAAQQAVAGFRRLGDPFGLHEALSCAVLIGAQRADAPALQPMVDEARALESDDWPPAARSYLRWAAYRCLRRDGREAEALACAVEQGELSALRDPVFTLRLTGVNVVDCELALGRCAQAEARARDALQQLQRCGVADGRLGGVYESLATALLVQQRVADALPVAREAYRRLAVDGDDLRLLDPLASALAGVGHYEAAARVAAHADATLVRMGQLRWPSAATRRAALESALRSALRDDERETASRAGAAMPRPQAYALAFALLDGG